VWQDGSNQQARVNQRWTVFHAHYDNKVDCYDPCVGQFLTQHICRSIHGRSGLRFQGPAWDGRLLLTSDNAAYVALILNIHRGNFPDNRTGTLQRGLAADGRNRIWKSNFTTDPMVSVRHDRGDSKELWRSDCCTVWAALDKWTTPGRMWLWMTEHLLPARFVCRKSTLHWRCAVVSYTSHCTQRNSRRIGYCERPSGVPRASCRIL